MKYSSNYSDIEVFSLSDIGRHREINEDYHGSFEIDNGVLCIVCDGVGGHNAGEVASRIAVEQIYSFFKKNYSTSPLALIRQSLDYANSQILSKSVRDPRLSGMGTTCVCLFIKDHVAYYGSVGDSRIYHLRNGILTQLTKDQSYVQQLVDSGVISNEEAVSHPRRNEVLNILGMEELQEPFLGQTLIETNSKDQFFLCTDGLTDLVNLDVVNDILKSFQPTKVKLQQLIDNANNNGGTDNITLQLISVQPLLQIIEQHHHHDSEKSISQRKRSLRSKEFHRRNMFIGILMGVLLGIIAAIILWHSDSQLTLTVKPSPEKSIENIDAFDDQSHGTVQQEQLQQKSKAIEFRPLEGDTLYSDSSNVFGRIIGIIKKKSLNSVQINPSQEWVKYTFQVVISNNEILVKKESGNDSILVIKGPIEGYETWSSEATEQSPEIGDLLLADIKETQVLVTDTIHGIFKEKYKIRLEGYLRNKQSWE